MGERAGVKKEGLILCIISTHIFIHLYTLVNRKLDGRPCYILLTAQVHVHVHDVAMQVRCVREQFSQKTTESAVL